MTELEFDRLIIAFLIGIIASFLIPLIRAKKSKDAPKE
jgi:hypothetical protein